MTTAAFGTPEQARAAGRKGGRPRKAKPPSADEVEALPPMDSPEHVRERLCIVQSWALTGRIPAQVASSANAAAREALSALAQGLEQASLRQLERRMEELVVAVAELRKQPRRVA